MAIDREHLQVANAHLEASGMKRYGWLTGELRVAFHQGKVPVAKLRELGEHFVKIAEPTAMADAMKAATAKLATSPQAAFEHLLAEAEISSCAKPAFDPAEHEAAVKFFEQTYGHRLSRSYEQLLRSNPVLLIAIHKAVTAGQMDTNKLQRLSEFHGSLTPELLGKHEELIRRVRLVDPRNVEQLLKDHIFEIQRTAPALSLHETKHVDEVVSHVTRNASGHIVGWQQPGYVIAPDDEGARTALSNYKGHITGYLNTDKIFPQQRPGVGYFALTSPGNMTENLKKLDAEASRLQKRIEIFRKTKQNEIDKVKKLLKQRPEATLWKRFKQSARFALMTGTKIENLEQTLLRLEQEKKDGGTEEERGLVSSVEAVDHKRKLYKYWRSKYGEEPHVLHGWGYETGIDKRDSRGGQHDMLELVGKMETINRVVEL